MNIYIVMWKDRHTAMTARPFSDPGKAIEWAKKKAKESYCYPDDGTVEGYQERDDGTAPGWIFYAGYSCEGDCIYVVKTKLIE